MHDREYYTSERFIWDHLKMKAANGLPGIYATWKSQGRIEPFIVAWPSEPILDDSGIPIQDTCVMDLPEDMSMKPSTIVEFARKTKAYALLLTEQVGEEVRVILESHHGTQSWIIPILTSADVRVLGNPRAQSDTHRIGVLWAPRKHPS